MRWICAALLLTVLPAWAGHTPPTILLRIHVQTPAEGLPSTMAEPVQIPPNNETIYIRTLPEVTEQNLIDASPEPGGGVRLKFDHVGQVNLDAVTAQNPDRILVVMIDGYVVFAPVIDEHITTGELVLPHPLQPQILQLLQDAAKKNVKENART
jgi:preprotein translocase subunit SecD